MKIAVSLFCVLVLVALAEGAKISYPIVFPGDSSSGASSLHYPILFPDSKPKKPKAATVAPPPAYALLYPSYFGYAGGFGYGYPQVPNPYPYFPYYTG